MIISMSLAIVTLLFLTGGASAQFFNGPESVTYDALNGRYLISNVLSGNIAQISDAGDTTFFDTTLARTLGMTIVDDMLYVADISGLVVFDLTTDEKVTTIPIAGMIELNDVTADTSGYLYITDSSAGRIYRMRISDYSSATIVSGLTIPNGILFDARNNRVLFCQFIPNAPIKEINLDDFSVTTVLSSYFANFDGLTIDGNGYIYVSCWGNNSVYRYDNAFSLPAERISMGHNGPADIFYNQRDDILAVPNYYSSIVDFLPITPAGVEEIPGRIPRAFALSQNYPNPFNPSTTIRFNIPNSERDGVDVNVKIYNLRGQIIRNLLDEKKPRGSYSIQWDGRNDSGESVSSGIYFYRIQAGDFSEMKRMVIMK